MSNARRAFHSHRPGLTQPAGCNEDLPYPDQHPGSPDIAGGKKRVRHLQRGSKRILRTHVFAPKGMEGSQVAQCDGPRDFGSAALLPVIERSFVEDLRYAVVACLHLSGGETGQLLGFIVRMRARRPRQ